MIAFLISMLLMPFVPQLQSPRDTYSDQLASVMKYLEHATPAVAPTDSATASPTAVPAEILASATPVEDKRQPDTIKGTLLRNQLYDPDTASKEDKDVDMEVPSVDSLVLTGVLTVGKEHVAILNDGVNDYVVGKGSYVLGVVKVNSVGSKSISLTDFRSSKESKQLELSLQDVGLPGDKK